jgi:phosphoglycerol transferase MdoB-like AlkP superfamily enzyme
MWRHKSVAARLFLSVMIAYPVVGFLFGLVGFVFGLVGFVFTPDFAHAPIGFIAGVLLYVLMPEMYIHHLMFWIGYWIVTAVIFFMVSSGWRWFLPSTWRRKST